MIRLLTCALACVLVMAPASAQSLQLADRETQPPTLDALELDVRFRTSAPARSALLERLPAAAAETSASLGRRASSVAATVVQTLAAQNRLTFGVPERSMDGYLRPPQSNGGDEGTTLFHEAKALYDEATSYRTDWYDFSFDPLSLKCHLKVRLSR